MCEGHVFEPKRLHIVLLVAAALLVYGNTLSNDFTLDDDAYIVQNPSVTHPSFRGLFEATRHNNVFRPASFATFALNWAAGGQQSFGFHLFNLLLHAAVTLLLYALLKGLLANMPQATTIAWVAALLFAVHPIHTEAVASISGRSELLAAGFLVAAWQLHTQDRQLLSLACFVFAMLSKESAIVFLPLVLAGDFARSKTKKPFSYIEIAGVTLIYLYVLRTVQGGRFGEKEISLLDNPLAYLTPGLRILNAVRIAWKYVSLQIYPARFSCDYSYNGILTDSNWRHLMPAAMGAALLLGLWVWALWTKRRDWFIAGAIYLVSFSITLNIFVPTGTIFAERLAYLPSAGFCLLVSLLWIRLFNQNRRLASATLFIVLAILSVRTLVRNQDWQNNFTLFSTDVLTVPGSAKLHAMLGGQFMHRNQWKAAHEQFATALEIYPKYPEVVELQGVAESQLGLNPEALQSFMSALSMTQRGSPSYNAISMSLATQLVRLGQHDDAIALLNDVITNSPGYSPAWSNRAAIRYDQGQMTAAQSDAETALRLDPKNAQAQHLLTLPGLRFP